jgi:glycosyltransferase involved in cell wall biosynthesis
MISEHASPLASLGGIDSGGQNVYVANVARGLADRGHQVDVFTRRESGGQPAWSFLCRGVRVVHVTAGPARVMPKEALLPYMGEFAENLCDFYESEMRAGRPYCVTHANFFMSGLVGLYARKSFGVPLVTTFHALGKVRRLHQGADDGFPAERLAIEESLVAESDRIVAECPQDQDDILKLYRGDPARLSVVPCGFDAKEMFPVAREVARAKLGFEPDGFSILQLGRLVPRKGIDNVIRALALLRQDYRECARLYVVGGNSESPDVTVTPEIGRLKTIAEKLNVADCVEFIGRRDRSVLRFFYSACDVFVTTPWYEPFGITPLEAMACARPVIGADVGGIRSTVVHEETGLLVPPKDPAALATALQSLIADDARRQKFAQAGFERARKLYTWAGVVRGLEAVYADAVCAATARPAAIRRKIQRRADVGATVPHAAANARRSVAQGTGRER